MSEPEVEWYIDRIKMMLAEIDGLISVCPSQNFLTNSIREIIQHNVNEIEINMFTVIRKLKDGHRKAQEHNQASKQQPERE